MNIESIIVEKLQQAFTPIHLEVLNESYMHRTPKGAESHFKVTLVSEIFCDKRLLARHRQVNEVLRDELACSVHALALHTYTPEEWFERQQLAPKTPSCVGSSLKS